MASREMGVREPAADSGPRGASFRRLLTIAALILTTAFCVSYALVLDFLSDDAFIAFRYARNLAQGHGLVYNIGERVEGYTSFFAVAVLAGLHRLGADLVTAGRGLSLAGAVAGVVLAWALARRSLRRWPSVALVAAVFVAVNPYVAAWAGAGLESTIFASFLLATALLFLDAGPVARQLLTASGLALLLSLTRPEGVALYVVLVASVFWSGRGDLRRRLRPLVPGLMLFVGLGAVYFAARWAYFGDALPNVFHAKSAFTPRHVARGFAYLRDFGRNAFVLCALPLVLVGSVYAARSRRALLVTVPITLLAIVVAEGGDGLPMYRFLVPVIPFLAVLAAVGCEALGERLGRRTGLTIGLVLAAIVAALSFYPRRDTLLVDFLYQRDREIPAWTAVGRALARAYPPETAVALVPIGAVGYYSGLRIVDMVGLTDRTIARTPVADLGAGWTGHEKHNGPYVLSRRPEILLLGNAYVDGRATLPPGQFPPYSAPDILAREKDVISHPAFARDYELRHLEVGPGLFLHYFGRRDSSPRR